MPELAPYRILDLTGLRAFRGRDVRDIELPVVVFSLNYELHLERVPDYIIVKDLENKTGQVQEVVPYKVELIVAAISDIQAEAEEYAQRVHAALGRAPAFSDIPWYIVRPLYGGAFELGGAYVVAFSWEGWVRLAGAQGAVTRLLTETRFTVQDMVPPPAQEETSPEPEGTVKVEEIWLNP